MEAFWQGLKSILDLCDVIRKFIIGFGKADNKILIEVKSILEKKITAFIS